MALSRYRVGIPLLLECGAILIQRIKEEEMHQPKMVGVGAIQSMHSLEPIEECSPASCKLGAHFYPKPLNSGIMSRAVCGASDIYFE